MRVHWAHQEKPAAAADAASTTGPPSKACHVRGGSLQQTRAQQVCGQVDAADAKRRIDAFLLSAVVVALCAPAAELHSCWVDICLQCTHVLLLAAR
jgi:hypothetical protein